MRILIVSEVYRPGHGGLQTSIDTLTKGLYAQGDEVVVLTGSPKGLVRPYWDEEAHCRVYRLPALPFPANPKNNRFTVLPRIFVRRFWKAQSKFDVIHMMTPADWLHLSVEKLAKKDRVPIIVTNHTLTINLTMNSTSPFVYKFAKWAEKRTIAFANRMDAMIAPTQSALDETPGITVPSLPISNGLDTNFFSPTTDRLATHETLSLDPRYRYIVFTGRLDSEKRVDLLIKAFGTISQDVSDIRLLIVGKGLLDEELRALTHELKLDEKIIFMGYVDEITKRDVLRIATLFVMPSPAELQCIAALEALACRCPIVVSDRVALPELTDGEKNGLIFSYPDETDLVEKMRMLLDNEGVRLKMATHAYKWVNAHHTIEKTITAYRAIYERVRGRESPPIL